MGPSRPAAAALALLFAALPLVAAAPTCDDSSVITLLGTDTSTDRALFTLRAPVAGADAWLIVVDGGDAGARLLRDSLAGLRTGAFHGPGPFLGATFCGAGCLQPVRLVRAGWEPVGEPIRHPGDSAVHFTYDRGGAPWLTLHSLSAHKGLVDVTSLRWNGTDWEHRGRLLVRAVGSPAAAPDPAHEDGILVGSGRFLGSGRPSHWIPALPAPAGSPGGQLFAVGGSAAVYLTFDSRLYTSLDGGSTWYFDDWRPWGQSGTAQPGTEYWIDLPAADHQRTLAALWYDEREPESPALHLARWSPRSGWNAPVTLPLAPDSMSMDHSLSTKPGGWLLLGRCVDDGREARLEALILDPDSALPRSAGLPLRAGW